MFKLTSFYSLLFGATSPASLIEHPCYGWLSCLLSWKHNMTSQQWTFVLVEGLTTHCLRFPSCILVEKTSNLIFRGSEPTDIPRPLQILSVWSSSSQSLLVSSGKNTVPLPKPKQKILTEIRKFLPTFKPLTPEWHCLQPNPNSLV